MIDLKQNPATGWNLLLLASVAGIAAAAYFGLTPAPTVSEHANDSRVAALNAQARKFEEKSTKAVVEIQAKGWNIGLEELGSRTLERLTKMAEKNHLQLTSFRTEKPTEVANMSVAPFVTVLEGPFTDVVGLVRELEAPDSKLAVNMLQVSASEGISGHVTATIGLLAYMPKEIR